MSQSFYFRTDMPNKAGVWNFFKTAFQAMVSGGGAEVSIKPYKKNKTDQQRKYAHACISVIAKHTGDNEAHLKVRIKHSLGLIEEIWSDGKTIVIEISTEKLNREDYGKFIDAIIQIAEAMEIKLPQPRMFGMEIDARAA